MKTIAKFAFLLFAPLFCCLTSMLPAAALTMATWQAEDGFPNYSIYNGTSWTPPAQISSNSPAYDKVFAAYNPNNGIVVATWVNSTDDEGYLLPVYSVYNGTTWSPFQPISSDFNLRAEYNVYISFNPVTETFVATWGDNNSYLPYYVIFDATGVPSAAAVIDNTYGVYYDVYTSVNTANGDVIATWSEYNDSTPTYNLYYSIYSSGSWSPVAQIGTSSEAAYDNITSIYDPVHNATIAVWSDVTSYNPRYAVYNGTSWVNINAINNSYYVYDNVFVSFNDDIQSVVATWSSDETYIATYSIYDFGTNSWSLPTTFGGVGLDSNNIINSFNPDLDVTIATFGGNPGDPPYIPYYSTYNGSTWTSSAGFPTSVGTVSDVATTLNYSLGISPPGNLTGFRDRNDFALVYEFFNTLVWTRSSTPDITGYRVYRDDVLIATLGPNTLSYEIHNIPKKEVTEYSVTAFNGSGESAPVTVTIYPLK